MNFNREIDRETGFVTRSILTVPLRDASGEVFAVAQLLDRADGQPFGEEDEKRFRQFADSVGVILRGWSRMAQSASPETRA